MLNKKKVQRFRSASSYNSRLKKILKDKKKKILDKIPNWLNFRFHQNWTFLILQKSHCVTYIKEASWQTSMKKESGSNTPFRPTKGFFPPLLLTGLYFVISELLVFLFISPLQFKSSHPTNCPIKATIEKYKANPSFYTCSAPIVIVNLQTIECRD